MLVGTQTAQKNTEKPKNKPTLKLALPKEMNAEPAGPSSRKIKHSPSHAATATNNKH